MAKVKVIVFHPEKCKGHLDCEKACSTVHFKTNEGGERSAIRIVKDKAGKYSATVCNHCGLCIDMCPVQALKRLASGTVALNKNVCVGCQACVAFCPTSVMRKARGVIVPFKCISCGQCVKACPEKALELKEFDVDDLKRVVNTRHKGVCP